MQTSVPFLNDTKCLSIDPHINPKIQVCAGEQGKTACQVIMKFFYIFNYRIIYKFVFYLKIDGGGPLVVQSNNFEFLTYIIIKHKNNLIFFT